MEPACAARATITVCAEGMTGVSVADRDRGDTGDVAHSHFQAACNAQEKGDTNAALSEIDIAISMEPSESVASVYWAMKGYWLHELSRNEEAKHAGEVAVELAPRVFLGWIVLGFANRYLGCDEEAAHAFREAVIRRPDPSLYTLLAEAELSFSPDAARDDAARALALDPSWDEAHRIYDQATEQIRRLPGEP